MKDKQITVDATIWLHDVLGDIDTEDLQKELKARGDDSMRTYLDRLVSNTTCFGWDYARDELRGELMRDGLLPLSMKALA